MIFFGIYSLSLETNQAEENFGARGQEKGDEVCIKLTRNGIYTK